MGWKRTVGIASVGGLLLVGAMWPMERAHLQAFAVLRLVSGQRVPSVVDALVREPVVTRDVTFKVNGETIRARSYLPAKDAGAPALMVLHGVHHLGMDEPRLMAFASAMASCGLRVLTPELPGIKDYRVSPDSVRVIGEAANWFAEQSGGPVGVMGLSFSGGLALVAASDEAYRQSFRFVFAVGSQDAMEHVSEYYLTGRAARPDGTIELLPAHEYGPLVLEYEHLDDYVPARDAMAVRAVLREHLYEDKTAEASARARLNARQVAEAARLMDASSPETRARLAAANRRYAEEMRALSPHGRLATMTVPVFLLHGQADNIIPAAETLWMASELPGDSLRAMLISPVLSHLDMDGAKPGVMDQWRLLHFFAKVMRAAES